LNDHAPREEGAYVALGSNFNFFSLRGQSCPQGRKSLCCIGEQFQLFFPLGDNHAPKEERAYVASGSNFNLFFPWETIMPPGKKELMLP